MKIRFLNSISHSLSFLYNFDLALCCYLYDEVTASVSAVGQVLILVRFPLRRPQIQFHFTVFRLAKWGKEILFLLPPKLRSQEWDTKKKIL